MNVRKTDDFLADVERQFEWYAVNAGGNVADRYLDAVEATCRLLGQHPHLGPRGGFVHPRLREWRFFLVFRPFHTHILFREGGEPGEAECRGGPWLAPAVAVGDAPVVNIEDVTLPYVMRPGRVRS